MTLPETRRSSSTNNQNIYRKSAHGNPKHQQCKEGCGNETRMYNFASFAFTLVTRNAARHKNIPNSYMCCTSGVKKRRLYFQIQIVHLDDMQAMVSRLWKDEEMKTHVDVGSESGISTNRPHVFRGCAPGNPGLPPAIAALAPHLRHTRECSGCLLCCP